MFLCEDACACIACGTSLQQHSSLPDPGTAVTGKGRMDPVAWGREESAATQLRSCGSRSGPALDAAVSNRRVLEENLGIKQSASYLILPLSNDCVRRVDAMTPVLFHRSRL